jgi:hypothetical protein
VTPLPAFKYAQAAAIVRAQVADGTLKPGQAAPSGAQLARLTGFCPLTCRRALRFLISEGTLVPGPSANARPRVAVPDGTAPTGASRLLSRALSALRRASGLSQPDLALMTGYSVTTIGHAETGRLWQSPQFWATADLALAAGGELVRLHDAYRAEAAEILAQPAAVPPARGAAAVPAALTGVTFHWSDGTAVTVAPSAFCVP